MGMTLLRIALLGNFAVARDNVPAPLRITRTGQTLLAYLLIHGQRQHSRDVLTTLLWGDQSQTQAQHCLNTALWRLRRQLEPTGVPRGAYLTTSGSGDVGFNWDSPHWYDAGAFEARLNRAMLRPSERMEPSDAQAIEEALDLYQGDLLEGFYDHWALSERERLCCLYLNGLTRLMRYYALQRQFEASLACGLKVLQHDPLREEIQREVIRLYLSTGQRAQAARQYETCRALLAEELGILPMVETQALFHQIALETAHLPLGAPSSPHSTDLAEVQQQLQTAIHMLNQTQTQVQSVMLLLEQFLTQQRVG